MRSQKKLPRLAIFASFPLDGGAMSKRRKRARIARGMTVKRLRQLTLEECGFVCLPTYGPKRLRAAAAECCRGAAAPAATCRGEHLSDVWERMLLQVPSNELCAALQLRALDSRLDELLIAQSASWRALGSRGGISDARRLLRWFRLSNETVEFVLSRADARLCARAL